MGDLSEDSEEKELVLLDLLATTADSTLSLFLSAPSA